MYRVQFNENGSFKILQFTDIHYSNDNETDWETVALMRNILKEEKPDFIMITGDSVYGSKNRQLLSKALAPVVESKIPFSYVFGNHDTEDGEGYDSLVEELHTLPGCVFYEDKECTAGVGNHIIEIADENNQVQWILTGIDSGNYSDIKHIDGYAWIKKEQIEWYTKKITEYEKAYSKFSSLIFMHIALPEFHDVWNYEICYGEKREGICSPYINSGFFAEMQRVGHTKGVFVGHDHINDFYGTMYGITLGYGRATGYNTYGQENFLRGARVFVLEKDNIEQFQTYVRLADGTIIDKPKTHLPERKRDN